MAKKKRYDYVREHFNKLGWLTSKIEVYDGMKMHDAFGCADMLVVAPERLIMIQVCGASDWKKHIDKLTPLNNLVPISKNATLYQIGVDKRKIGNMERWVYQIGIYKLDSDGKPVLDKLNSFKDKEVNLETLVEYEKDSY